MPHGPPIRLVTPHAPRGPAATDMLAAGGSCCINQDPAQLCESRSRVPSADHTFTLSKGQKHGGGKHNLPFWTHPNATWGEGDQGAQQGHQL